MPVNSRCPELPETYLIAAECKGFVASSKRQKQSISVGASDANEAITLKLSRTGAVSGRVLDPEGHPITGASVQVQPVRAKKDRPAVGDATSDDRGNYRAYNIPPGVYKVAVTYSSNPQDSQVLIQRAKDKAKGTGPEAYVRTYYPGTLDSAQATVIQVDAGADIQGIDVELHQTKTVRVRGKVNSADSEIPGQLAVVVLASSEGGSSATMPVHSDGSFEFTQVTPGSYTLAAMGVLAQNGNQLTATKRLEVGESDIDGVQLALSRARPVSGTVVPPAGRKLPAGLMVILQRRDPSMEAVGHVSGGIAQVKENGTFSFESVAPDIYDLVLGSVGEGDDLYVSSIRSGDQDALASGVHVTGSVPSRPIEVLMKANGAQIDCRVVDEAHRPVPEAHVVLLPDAPRTSQVALHGTCETDAAATCKIFGVVPGEYHLFAVSRENAGEFSNLNSLDPNENLAQAIAVGEGDHKSIELQLISSDKEQ